MTTHRTRAAAAAGLIGLSSLLLAACGSSGSTGTGTAAAASPSSSARGAAMKAYRDCLSRHGVNLPTSRPSGGYRGGGGSGGGFGGGGGGYGFGGGASANPTMQAAMQACASLRPQGGFGGRGGFNSTATAAFRSCLKDHGVTLPTTGGFRALNTTDPKTAAAYNICKPLMPSRSPGASPSASA